MLHISLNLVWWEIKDTNDNVIKVTNAQMLEILKEEARGTRLVLIGGDRIINPAFIKSANKIVMVRDDISLLHEPLTKEDEKYLFVEERKKLE